MGTMRGRTKEARDSRRGSGAGGDAHRTASQLVTASTRDCQEQPGWQSVQRTANRTGTVVEPTATTPRPRATKYEAGESGRGGSGRGRDVQKRGAATGAVTCTDGHLFLARLAGDPNLVARDPNLVRASEKFGSQVGAHGLGIVNGFSMEPDFR